MCLPLLRNKVLVINNSYLPAAVEGSPLDVAPDALLREEWHLDATRAAEH